MQANQRPGAVPMVYACQQYSSTVTWWNQCRKMTGFFCRTRKTVSNSSGILLKMNIETQKPHGPLRYHDSGSSHSVKRKPFVCRVATRWGTVTMAPRMENMDSATR